MILIVHIFMNVNKPCLNQRKQKKEKIKKIKKEREKKRDNEQQFVIPGIAGSPDVDGYFHSPDADGYFLEVPYSL